MNEQLQQRITVLEQTVNQVADSFDKAMNDIETELKVVLRIAAEPVAAVGANMASGGAKRTLGDESGLIERGANLARGQIVQPSARTLQSGFRFGAASLANQIGVKRQLVEVAVLALSISTQDFMFFEGLRAEARQRRLVSSGMSKTMLSKHRAQADGLAHAMDLVPTDSKGAPKWEWPLIYPVVMAVDTAATRLGYAQNIVWGGAWDRRLSDFCGDAKTYERECRLYAERHPGKDFLDGPHYEWRD